MQPGHGSQDQEERRVSVWLCLTPTPTPEAQYCHAGPSSGSVSYLKAQTVLVLKWWPRV